MTPIGKKRQMSEWDKKISDIYTLFMLPLFAAIERFACAIEESNEIKKSYMINNVKCPSCTGDGKGYDGHRCIRCGGSGVRT
jgi:hypothetical protein